MKNKQFSILMGKIVGVITVASLGSLGVAQNADASNFFLLFSDTDSFTNELTELVGMPELTVSKYTPPAGVPVTKVQVMLMATLKTEGTLLNDTDQTASFIGYNAVVQFDLVPTVESPPLFTLQPFPPFTTIGEQNYLNLPPGTTAPFGPFTLSGMANQSLTGDGIVNFLGSGTITYAPFTQIFTVFFGGGLDSNPIEISTFADATLTIKYFTGGSAIPEPSPLLGLGVLAGLGFVNKRRSSKKS